LNGSHISILRDMTLIQMRPDGYMLQGNLPDLAWQDRAASLRRYKARLRLVCSFRQ
jgi:hypothetical protein